MAEKVQDNEIHRIQELKASVKPMLGLSFDDYYRVLSDYEPETVTIW